jgi:enoyl-CoA hydratase/carnithine racemase
VTDDLGTPPTPHVSWTLDDGVFTITLNRPDVLNAMSTDMYEGLRNGVRIGSSLSHVAVILLRGVPGSFAVGGDLESFLQHVEQGSEHFIRAFESVYDDPLPFRAILQSHKPVVAAIDGLCVAGGLLIAMCCDITVASARSRFGIPEARVGLADAATTQLVMPSIGVVRARYLALTGKMIDAPTAESWGLITRFVPEEAFEEAVTQVIKDLRRASPTAQRAYKQLFTSTVGVISPDTLMEVAMSPDGKEGLRAFLEKREPQWPSLR